jgi:alpha-mannosidase
MQPSSQKPKLYILVNNHFDPTWRRCWKRPLEFKGKTFISYNDIETYYLLDNIALAQENPEYKFAIECPLILRTILKDHPEALPVLQQLSKEGRFEISGSGETIVDANMIHGESLVRNFVDGILWVENTFGQKTNYLLRNDAFGNSAQLPQIAHELGIECIFGLHYSWPQNTYWRGLDGSTVLQKAISVAGAGGGIVKYPPCESCNGSRKVDGMTCSVCEGRGIPTDLLAELPRNINPEAFKETGAAIVMMGPEEMLPNPELIDWAKKMGEDYDVRFAVVEELIPYTEPLRKDLANVAEADLHPSVELNPNNAGVWVSRIKTKQIVRRQEQAMLGLESLLVMDALRGEDYPAEPLKSIRQNMYFTMFHDAITATHVDAAYDELLDIMDNIDEGINGLQKKALIDLSDGNEGVTVINSFTTTFTGLVSIEVPGDEPVVITDDTGTALPVISTGDGKVQFLVKGLPAFSSTAVKVISGTEQKSELVEFTWERKEAQTFLEWMRDQQTDNQESLEQFSIENSRFRVDADENGLVRVFDKKLNKDILITDEYRPAELILEHDEGSPWATLTPDFTRTSLAKNTHLKSVEKNGAVQQLVFVVQGDRGMGLSGFPLRGELTVRLVEGMDRVEFSMNTYWSTFNHRLRVAMPVPKTGDTKARYLYDIPYGTLERHPYEPSFDWAGANGDWPGVHWAGIEQDGLSVALFNHGTPSYLMEAGEGNSEVMFLSLLRSPAIPTYLHEPYFYTMTDYEGMRDEGDHEFTFAIGAYDESFAESSVVLDGETYQQVLPVTSGKVELPEMPVVESDTVRLTAVKWAEKGEGIVLRLVEYRGRGGTVQISIPKVFRSAEQVNLLEQPEHALPVAGGKVTLELKRWEIASLKLSI